MVAIYSMDGFDTQFGKPDAGVQIDLRQRVAARLLEQADIITGDSAAIFPQSGGDVLDIEYRRRVGQLLTQLLALAVRDGRVDTRGGFVGDLCSIVLEQSLPADRVFTFAYLTERTAADELALSDSLGATTEAWPIVAEMIRRASFDVLAAYTERAHIEPAGSAVIDRLTTLYSRAMFDAVLAKEVDRAGRFGQPFSIILFDVDRLSAINQDYGYGVGDKVLERLGILMRTYFRQHDWVARHSEDSMAVLLTHTGADRAIELAERVRHTVESRLWFTDHRTERQVPVTVSAAVVNVPVSSGDVIDPEQLIALAEAAIDRAKREGRNRVETVDGSPAIRVRLPSY
jgi:diguanylate cyclase (GGDEF)-like protein